MWKVASQIKSKCSKMYAGKAVLVLSAVLGLSFSPLTEAKITDLTQVRCSDIFPNGTEQISERDQRHFMLLVFWLGGFEAGIKPSTQVDITRVQEIATTLLAQCKMYPEDTCFGIMKRCVGAAQIQQGDKVEAAAMSAVPTAVPAAVPAAVPTAPDSATATAPSAASSAAATAPAAPTAQNATPLTAD